MGIPFTTDKLLSELTDRLLDTAKTTGIANAVQTLDHLLTSAERRNLPGYELTLFRGLRLADRWDIAPGLYALPYPAFQQQLRRRVQRIPDSLLFRVDSKDDHSITVLVGELRWGPIFVSAGGRTLSDAPYPVQTVLSYNHNPILLVALLAVTLNLPLWVLLNTQRADPWVEDFLNVEGGGASLFAAPSHLNSCSEASRDAKEITERAFRNWNSLSSADREDLALAVSRLSASLSRADLLAAQDRVLDVSIALEILYRLDHQEITYKLSTRAGWYLGNDFGHRVKTSKAINKFYGLRSRIIHGGKSKRPNFKDERQIREEAFDIARATLLQHLERGRVPTKQDWSEIVMGADANAEA